MFTLDEIKVRVRFALEDNSAARFGENLLEAAIRQTLARMDERLPRVLSAEIEITDSSRNQSLAGIENCLYLVSLAYPAGSSAECELEPDTQFSYTLVSGIPRLHFSGIKFPHAGDKLRVTYAAQNTLAGFDDAEETTLPAAAETALVNGISGYACILRAASIADSYGSKPGESTHLIETAHLWLDLFERALDELKVLQEFGFPVGFALDQWDKHGR